MTSARRAHAPRRAVRIPRALEWRGGIDGVLRLLEQTALPESVRYLEIDDLDGTVGAICRLDVRGAPAIGCAAAYGMVLGLRASKRATRKGFAADVERVHAKLARSRPTAVNLFWALDRMRELALSLDYDTLARESVLERLLEEARSIHREDEDLCRAIGEHGAALLATDSTVLTHCNAGSLATGGLGTALAVIYRAVEAGKRVRVLADETRPLLQGARLTSWELHRAGIDVTVICDNAAGAIMARGEIDHIVVGADRIALNGDVANKIGTYALAVLAREHHIPFWVAAPSTTFDRKLRSGAEIPIENRKDDEVTQGFGRRTVPRDVAVLNPAFDVTPARFITGIITEEGVLRPPYGRSIRKLLASVDSDPRRARAEA